MNGLGDKKLLVIDDDHTLCDLVAAVFKTVGATTFVAYCGEQGLREFYSRQPDLVLLDLMMPGMNGLEVLRRIRELSDVPVIVLSVIDKQDEVVQCLEIGADDYVTKPYQPQILMARVLAAVRRASSTSQYFRLPRFDDGYLMFDLEAHVVKVAGQDVHLSPTEFGLLSYLARNMGRVCTYAQILDHVWEDSIRGSEQNIHTYIYQLRKKIECDPGAPRYLISHRSVGYRFQYPSSH